MKRWLVVCLLVLLGAGASPVCMVTDLKGPAPVKLFAMLEAGQEVALPAGSSAVLSFVSGGVRSRVTGPCKFRLSASGVEMLSGAPAVVSRAAESASAPLAAGVNLDKIGGLRRGDLHLTCDPAFAVPVCDITWSTTEEFPEVEVLVEDSVSMKRVIKKSVPGKPSVLRVELEQGRAYQVTLTGFRADGSHVPSEPTPVPLRVLSREEFANISALRQEAISSPNDLAPAVELLAAYLAAELYRPAEALTGELLRKRPEDPTLKKLAADLETRRR